MKTDTITSITDLDAELARLQQEDREADLRAQGIVASEEADERERAGWDERDFDAALGEGRR